MSQYSNFYSSDSSDSSDLGDEVHNIINDMLMEEFNGESFSKQLGAQIIDQVSASSNQRRSCRRRFIDRGREEGDERLKADYFSNNPVYNNDHFRRRFRMGKHLFLCIVEKLGEWSPYFCQRTDALNRMGLSPLQKCTAAIRILAYGSLADHVDEYVRIGESTAIECVTNFVRGINEIFGPQYLRRPTVEDIHRLLEIGERRGFPGMLGSIDCMHWEWKNCPVAWQGQFTRGDYGVPTIMLEAVASKDLWIWHAFFGVAGSNNDINVLNQSPLFTQVLQGQAPPVQFIVNNREYNMGYYLADGIYPEWAAFVKTIPLPQTDKHKLFAQHQEAARKDVERAFGVLQSRFAIVRGPARFWHRQTLTDIMYACIILHNMIVEDERHSYAEDDDFNYDQGRHTTPIAEFNHGPLHEFSTVLQRNQIVRDRSMHQRLKNDLIEHIWQRFGENQVED